MASPAAALNHPNIDGGAPVELARGSVSDPAVSPDGECFAYIKREGEGVSAKTFFVVQQLEGGPIRYRVIAPFTGLGIFPSGIQLSWTPDGRNLTYIRDVVNRNAVHLYMQPLSGGPPLLHFVDSNSMSKAES